jgi:hypothetical protein
MLPRLTLLAMILAISATAELTFNADVRPILSDKCFGCHGFDAKHRKGDLRLDIPEAAYAKGKSGAVAIVPGKPDESELWARISLPQGEDDHMPPLKTKKQLSAQEKAILRQWIEQGAPYQKHWAFEPAREPASGNSIDDFVNVRLTEKQLPPATEAPGHTLIRRVAFALTGLPPSLEELDAFIADDKPGAYERMVDRYLASDRYGEEMARHWLDIARYADTHGMHLDNERQMYAYRDWVVGAFNRNLPFDQFTIEQIAGDLLPEASNEQLVATGFNRCNITTGEGGSIQAEWIYRYAVERATTTAQTWLGLSAGCAECHDHKYDPISTKDFFSFYAFFHSNADPAMDGNKLLTPPVVKVAPAEYDDRVADFDTRIAELEAKMDAHAKTIAYSDPAEADPPPAPTEIEQVWFEDDFPEGAKKTSDGTFVEDPVFSGQRALRRDGPGLKQDFYEGGSTPLEVPANATFFVHVYLAPDNPPKEIMIQFHTGGWQHRAYWGGNLIDWGKQGTGERFHAGDLPKTGEWVRLEVPAASMNLKQGSKVTGYAFTIHDGSVYFDKMGLTATVDPSKDPATSFAAWRQTPAGKNAKGKPEEIKSHYLRKVCATTRDEFAEFAAPLAKLSTERKTYLDSFPSTFVFRDLPNPRKSFVMMRGQYDQPGEEVQPNTFAVLPPLQKADPSARATRLDLAKWLVSPQNPLTARVAVNRFWQQLFGVGIVKTSHDLGTQGDLPSHPELLDWLALRFQAEGWDVKALMRRMLLSRAYRRASTAPAAHWRGDPENRYLARGPRLRLDAEQLRDSALYTGGILNTRMGGQGVRTYQPPNIWEPVGFRGSNTANYKRDNGDALYRRSLYVFLKRTAPAPFLANFDAPNRESACYRRERSNTPLQALQLMNDVQFFEAARGLATRMLEIADSAARIDFAYRSVLSRPPTAEERELILAFQADKLASYQQASESARAAITFGDSKPPANADPVELAAWTLVANLILNLDESIVRN